MLTLDDLYTFFSKKKKNVNFDSKETGYKICVRTPALFEEEQSDSETLMFANIQMFHIGVNRNKSAVTQEAAENCLSGIKYKPVLASIIYDEQTDLYDFNGHDMEFDDEGNVTYIEKQVGCFTAQEPYIAEDPEHDNKSYVFAKCAIPRDYTQAANIIERKGGTDVSVELLVNACSFNAKEKYLELTDIEVAGLTLLGSGTAPGMVGSKLQLEDFAYSEEEPKISFSEDQMNTLIDSLVGLQKTLESFNNTDRKEENVVKDKTLNNEVGEELEENNELVENENLEQTEELEENKELEGDAQFDGEGDGGESASGEDADPTDDDPTDDDDPEDGDGSDDGDDDDDDDSSEEGDSSTDLGKKRTLNREMTHDGLSFAVNFEVSHEDIRYALYNLISSWDEEDNDWYFIEKVYDNKFIATGFWNNQIWGSEYDVDGDNVNLKGDRYALHVEYLTDEEQAQLNNMRSNYSALQEKVSKYELAELNAQRDEILNDEKYAEYQDADRFKELRENKENYSLEDLRTQCELAFAAQFDAGKKPQTQTFAQELEKNEPKKSPKMFAFMHVEETTNEFLNGLMGRK